MITKHLNERAFHLGNDISAKGFLIDESFNSEFFTPPPTPWVTERNGDSHGIDTRRPSSKSRQSAGVPEPKTVTMTFLSLANTHPQPHHHSLEPNEKGSSRPAMESIQVAQFTQQTSLTSSGIISFTSAEGGGKENIPAQQVGALDATATGPQSLKKKSIDQLFSSIDVFVSGGGGSASSNQCNWSTNGVCLSRDGASSMLPQNESQMNQNLHNDNNFKCCQKTSALCQQSPAFPARPRRHDGRMVYPDPSQHPRLHRQYPYLYHLCCPINNIKITGSMHDWSAHQRVFPSALQLPHSAPHLIRVLLLKVLNFSAVLKEKIGPIGCRVIHHQLQVIETGHPIPSDLSAPFLPASHFEQILCSPTTCQPFLQQGNPQLPEDIFCYAADRLVDLCASSPADHHRFTRAEKIFTFFPIQCIVFACIIISCRYWTQEAFFRLGFTRNDVLRHLIDCYPEEMPFRVLTPQLLTDLEMQILTITRADLNRLHQMIDEPFS